jgi:hypothetical protein
VRDDGAQLPNFAMPLIFTTWKTIKYILALKNKDHGEVNISLFLLLDE